MKEQAFFNRTIGEKISPILEEIEDTLWEFEYNKPEEKPNFTEDGLRASIKIFMANLLDKMWDRQEKENMPFKDREKQAEYFGKEFRELVLLATGIDPHKLYKKER